MGEQVAAGLYGGIAQLGEHLPCKQGVQGFESLYLHSVSKEIGTCTLKTAYKHNLYLFRAEQIRRQNDESCLHERSVLAKKLFGE